MLNKKRAFYRYGSIILFLSMGVLYAFLPHTADSVEKVTYLQNKMEQIVRQYPNIKELSLLRDKFMDEVIKDKKIQLRSKYKKLLNDDDWLYEIDYQLDLLSKENIPLASDEELEKQAAKLYPIYEKGERVVVVYKKNPNVVTSQEGIFMGFRGGFLMIAGRQIRLQDMEGIVGNDTEILKFLSVESKAKRQKFITEKKEIAAVQRKQWKKENREALSAKLQKEMGQFNEQNGYIFYNGQWYSSQDACIVIMEDSWKNIQNRMQRENLAKRKRILTNQQEEVAILMFSGKVSPLGKRLSPEAELQRREIAHKKNMSELERRKKAANDARLARIAEQQNKLKRIEEKAQRERKTRMEAIRNQVVKNPDDFEKGFFTSNVLFSGMAVIMITGVFLLIFLRKKEKGNDLSKFFVGKGELQKNFWATANADPDNFHYVAYMFPGLKEANEALAQMSYISIDRGGNLYCSKDIRYGAYLHLHGAVAFIGGKKLNYALWREASAVWPELEGAEYFKVSSEPVVLVEVPDLAAFSKNEGYKVKDLGVEDITGENGEIIRCYNFKTDTKEHAEAFLTKFNISEEGVVVHVVTDEGMMEKNLKNGIYDPETLDVSDAADAKESPAEKAEPELANETSDPDDQKDPEDQKEPEDQKDSKEKA